MSVDKKFTSNSQSSISYSKFSKKLLGQTQITLSISGFRLYSGFPWRVKGLSSGKM